MNKELKWPAIAIQAIILGNISILAQNSCAINSYLFISSLAILSLFLLQSISRRFLLLYPLNNFLKEPVPSIDTYILRILIFISIVSFFSGLACNSALDYFMICKIEKFLMSIIQWMAIFFLGVLPLIWIIGLRNCSDNKVVNKLKEKKLILYDICKKCKGYARIKREVTSKYLGRDNYNCEKCGEYHEDVKLNIAY